MVFLSYSRMNFQWTILENHVLNLRLDAMQIIIWTLFWHLINNLEIKRWTWYDQKEENKDGSLLWSSKGYFDLTCELNHEGSKSWEDDYKIRIHGLSLSQACDVILHWDMVDQDMKHAIDQMTNSLCISIVCDGWRRYKLDQHEVQNMDINWSTHKTNDVSHEIRWSCDMVSILIFQ